MPKFSNGEMADMHFVYGLANGNAYEARRIYAERFPQREIPHSQTFSNIHQRLQQTGTFERNKAVSGRPAVARVPAIEDAVLHAIEQNPGTSTRKIASELPFNQVQALLLTDFPARVAFCQWFRQMVAGNPQFPSQILFTDEANFSREAIMNFHTNHIWAEENPHAIQQGHFQQQFLLNVWCGMIGDSLVGPYFFPARLTGELYRQFLEENLPELLEDVPLQARRDMWYMHDGAPAHFSIITRQYLDAVYPNRWIGRAGPQAWPPRSPDLNPLDYFLWGHLKSLVYVTPVENDEDLRNRIIASCNTIRNTPGILERVRQSMMRRTESCIVVEGRHFEQLL